MVFPFERETNHWNAEDGRARHLGLLMVAPEVQGIDLFTHSGYCCRLAGGLAVGRNGRGRRGGKPTFTAVSPRDGGSSDLESGGRCGGAGTSAPRSGAVHPLSHASSGPAPTGCSSACALTTA